MAMTSFDHWFYRENDPATGLPWGTTLLYGGCNGNQRQFSVALAVLEVAYGAGRASAKPAPTPEEIRDWIVGNGGEGYATPKEKLKRRKNFLQGFIMGLIFLAGLLAGSIATSPYVAP